MSCIAPTEFSDFFVDRNLLYFCISLLDFNSSVNKLFDLILSSIMEHISVTDEDCPEPTLYIPEKILVQCNRNNSVTSSTYIKSFRFLGVLRSGQLLLFIDSISVGIRASSCKGP